MAKTLRERIVIMILPAVWTSIIYMYGPGATVSTQHKRALQEFTEVQKGGRGMKAVDAAQDQLEVAHLATLQARTKNASLLQPIQSLPSGADGQTLEFISRTFKAHGLLLTKSERLNRELESLPKNLREQWKDVSGALKLTAPQVWQIEAEGGYSAMVEACTELTKGPMQVIPLTVMFDGAKDLTPGAPTPTPTPGAQPHSKHWVLTVWL